MKIKLFIRVLRQILQNEYLLIETENEGIVREGRFIPCDFNRYELVDRTTHLVVEKGRYRITQKDSEGSIPCPGEPSGMFVIDNSRNSYDRFWGDQQIIDEYLSEARLDFFEELYNACRDCVTGRILDIGCGSGDFLRIIAARTPHGQFHGLDFSWSGVQRSKTNLPQGQFINGDIYATGYRNHSFDTVLCTEVLEHLEDPQTALQELARICTDTGTLIVTVPNGAHDSYVGHLHFWSESGFRQMLHGLHVNRFLTLENDRTMLFILKKSKNVTP